jgi:hypothetical protein
MAESVRSRRAAYASLIFFGAICWLLPALFIGWHFITPSDGARLSRANQVFSADGAILSPYAGSGTPIQEGDVLLAVNGASIRSKAEALFCPRLAAPAFRPGDTLEYSILRDGQPLTLQLKLIRLSWRSILAEHWGVLLFFLVTQAVVIFVYSRQPDDRTARAFYIWGMSGSHTYSWAFFLQVSDLLDGTGNWLFHLSATGLWLVFWSATLHMALVLPKPLFSPKRPAAWLIGLYLSSFILCGAYLTFTWFTAGNKLTWWASWSTAQTLAAAIYSLPALLAIMLQYFTTRSAAERIKVRWMILGTVISLSLGLGLYFIPSLFMERPILSPNGLGVINFPFIITTAIAIWRYQLFDIDLIIRRTLVYSSVTAALALIYFAAVTVLQAGFTLVSGQQSTAAIVISTLAIAALFNPLRRRIQEVIDRRFYRQKYDAEKVLAEFAATARSETDLERLTRELMRGVQETVQPGGISLWMQMVQTASRTQNGKRAPE